MSFEVHIGLIFACPFQLELDNCPLKDFRLNNSRLKRVSIWKKMSNAEITDLIAQHHVCVAYREKGLM